MKYLLLLLFFTCFTAIAQQPYPAAMHGRKGIKTCTITTQYPTNKPPYNKPLVTSIHRFDEQGYDTSITDYSGYSNSDNIRNILCYKNGLISTHKCITSMVVLEEQFYYEDTNLIKIISESYNDDKNSTQTNITLYSYLNHQLATSLYIQLPDPGHKHTDDGEDILPDTTRSEYTYTDSSELITYYRFGKLSYTEQKILDKYGAIINTIHKQEDGKVIERTNYSYTRNSKGQITEIHYTRTPREALTDGNISYPLTRLTYNNEGQLIKRESYSGTQLVVVEKYNYGR